MAEHNEMTKMEFSVRMTCSSCAEKVKSKLSVAGVFEVCVDVPSNSVLVETVLTTSEVHSLLETTGLPVFFKGFGSSFHTGDVRPAAAVAALKGKGQLIGLVRMVQASAVSCVVEATLDGLPAGEYAVNIHELGDLSDGGKSCGDVYGFHGNKETSGYLGSCQVEHNGMAAVLQVVSKSLQVTEVIGRSVVVSSGHERLMYGIIARSAGLFENPKQLCTCDGVSIWDEASKTKHF